MKIARDLKVGLFVLAGLLFSAVVIFLIGDERRLFSSSVTFKSRFANVQGLKAGAPIQMGGIDVGHVESVGYGKDPADTTVYVTLDVVESEAGRIRRDTKVKIVNKGLLGDKMVELTKGQSNERVPPGGEILTEEPDDMLAKANNMAEKADDVMDNLKSISQNFADERLHKDLRESVAQLNKMLTHVTEGEGYPRRFLTDKQHHLHPGRFVDHPSCVGAVLASSAVGDQIGRGQPDIAARQQLVARELPACS